MARQHRNRNRSHSSESSDVKTTASYIVGICIFLVFIGYVLPRLFSEDARPTVPNAPQAHQVVLPPVVSQSVTAAGGSGAAPAFQNGDKIDLPANPRADGTAYYVTLYPQPVGTDGWNNADFPIEHVRFQSPKNEKVWLKLNVMRGKHFQSLDVTGTCPDAAFDNIDLSADRCSPHARLLMRSPKIMMEISVLDVQVGSDPDPTEPITGKVFKKLALKLQCTTVHP